MIEDVTGRVEAVLALIALLGAVALLGRKIFKLLRRAAHFLDDTMPRIQRALDDVIGEEGKPGLVERLEGLEANQRQIKHELYPNGGGSLRDTVDEVRGLAYEARERAAEAVDEAAALQAALGRADHAGRQERERAQVSLDRVLDAFLDDRREQEHKTRAYITALKSLGIDLTDVVEELEANPWDGVDRRDP